MSPAYCKDGIPAEDIGNGTAVVGVEGVPYDMGKEVQDCLVIFSDTLPPEKAHNVAVVCTGEDTPRA